MLCVGAKAETVTFTAGEDITPSGGTSLTKGPITFSVESGGGMLSNTSYYRVSGGRTATFKCNGGYITQIVFTAYTGNLPTTFSCNVGNYDTDNYTWTGNSESVVFKATKGQIKFTKVKVTYTLAGKQKPGYYFAKDPATALLGYEFVNTLMNKPSGLEISYSSSNTDVATVESDGTVKLIKAGETIIKATSNETDTYSAGEAQYTLTVKELTSDGSKAKPFSVSDLYDLNSLGLIGANSVYVKGVISSVDQYSRYLEGRLVYHISDDGTASNVMDVYSKGLGGVAFSATSDLMPGSVVTVTGTIQDNDTGVGLETIAELTSIDVPFYVFPDGYATLYYGGFALKVPAGVTATVYSYADNNLNASKTYTEGDVLPAKTAVVLNAVGGKYYFPGTTETGETPEATNLYGYDKATLTDVDGMGKYYMLSLNADKDPNSIGFYWGEENGAAFTSKAHKAFLALPADATAKGFAFNDVTNGISAKTIAAEQDNAPVYSLTGMRMSGKLPAGIYVKNGKKFVVK